ncbi:MAG: N-formylglutamate amidohydrolase, partial [Roseiarcus sp.]
MDAEVAKLLGDGDPPSVELVHADGNAPVLLVCDHASRRVPRGLGTLGLDGPTLARHIGWDIGAAVVARRVAALLDAPAILGGYSRLVIDCNRNLDDPTSIPAVSDGVPVPGNRELSTAARAARVAAIFRPFHGEIETALDGFAA